MGYGRAGTGSLPGRDLDIPRVPFAPPAEAGTVLPTGEHSIGEGENPHATAVCPGEGGKGAFLFFFQPPSLETESIQSFLTYPKVKAIEKFKAPFPKLPALCFHFRILGEGCK